MIRFPDLALVHVGMRIAHQAWMQNRYLTLPNQRMRWRDVMRPSVESGVVATLAMSMVMYAFQRAGFLGRMPPRLLVERMLAQVHLRRELPRKRRIITSGAAHLGFGATQGVVYATGLHALAIPGSGKRLRPSWTTAVPFALAVWALSYSGWIPALGLMRRPAEDRPGRPTAMIIAHVVYGLVLARALTSRLR